MPDTSIENGDPVVLFVVGTGAIAGAWPPIFRALRRTISPKLADDADLANMEMARLIHLLRFFQGRHPETEATLRKELSALRIAISEELRAAEDRKELVVRDEFVRMLPRLAIKGRPLGVITTNWDRTLDRAVRDVVPKVEVYHLHGDIENPQSLYLPSEISMEGYRDKDETVEHAFRFQEGIRAVESATHLVIYGLSLSALDAELCQLFWLGRDGKTPLQGVRVVDLEPERVGRRLITLIGEERLPEDGILCHDPRNVIRLEVPVLIPESEETA